MNNSEGSSENTSTEQCPVCQATWIDGQLFWATGKRGRNIDLAGLVCNRLETLDKTKFRNCTNPCKGQKGGDTWADRMKEAEEYEGKTKPHE